jgi:hypothetical protein
LGSAERMKAHESQLMELLDGSYKPKSALELVDFARLCALRQHFSTSCRLWGEAFKTNPRLADDIRAGLRYQAARAAAQAAHIQQEGDTTSGTDRPEQLRTQALAWLNADLAAHTRILDSGVLRDRATLPRRLGQWRVDPALAYLHDDAVLAGLSEPERRAWQRLWEEGETLRKRILRAGLPTGRGPPF